MTYYIKRLSIVVVGSINGRIIDVVRPPSQAAASQLSCALHSRPPAAHYHAHPLMY